MNLSFRFGTEGESNVQVLAQDDERVLGRGWRLDPNGQRKAVLVVLPTAEHPTPSSLDRLAHEYELKDELDDTWAARPLELAREGGRTMLVLEDPGGEPLDRLLGTPMELGRFVRVAIGIAIALGKLHQRGLVHMDLKPAHILVNGAEGQVRLTGFGLASRLPRQRQAPEPPETIAGTLAYMAPEQTGRMNRSIDARSDLYALGIIFYQMLTGVLPFAASDPMGWVHCHIARQPMSPAERLKGIPEPLSAIVMKLLAKVAEERYQTAAGLAHDLRRCLAAWATQSRIEAFPLGMQDLPDRLLIPEKLYGREREIETLLAAFDHVVQGGVPELVLVSGYSGIGKSSVVHELHKVLVPSRGLFASGKFDQHKRDIPYATLAQAFQSLIRGLLAKSETELAGWRDALREALGSNGQLMVDLVPELRLIIDEQPPVPLLEPQQAHGRFQLVFRRFIGVFARSEHPLVLFLDDLQWLDAATLDLLEDLLIRSNLQHLMLIGAYRDNEVTADHPLTRKLDAIKSAGGTVAEITVAPLTREHLGQMMADALRCQPERAAPLAQLVHEKTDGNPFFAIQFLSSLAEEGMLTFDHDATRWCWDLNRIHAKGYSDNVVDLMVGKLTRLPAETRKALQQLACLGNITELTTLSIVFETSEEQIHVALWPAVRQELVERLTGAYRFVHDRIQEAAYSLIPEELRSEAHLRIGRLLAAHIPPEKREEAIFDIVNQLNRGAALVTSRDECEQLAELNLLAGQRAKDSTAHAAALTYFTTGAALLPEDARERRPELAFALELHRAECEFLTGKLAEAEERFAELADRATSLPDLAAITRLQVELFTTLGRSNSAVEVTLDYLRRVGIAWSAHPTKEEARQEYARMWRQLGERSIEALLDLPRMADPVACGTMNILTAVVPAARHTDENLRSLVIGRMANLSLEHGNSDASCHAYAMLGTVLGPEFGDYKAGFRFGQLGLNLVEQRGLRRFEARVSVSFGAVINPWTRHVQTGRQWVRRAFDTANRLGDLTFAAYSRNNLITNLLAAGDPLDEVQREAEAGLDFARRARFGLVIVFITTQLQLVRTLRGLTPVFGRFDDTGFDEGRFERHLEADPGLSIATCWYWIRKLQARFFAGAYASGLKAASKAQRLLWTMPAHLEWAEFHFYAALVRAALCDAARAAERSRHLKALATHHRQLQEWTENCPENFANRAALVGAEIARIEGRELDAERLYEQAIRSARGSGFVHNEAIAYERASAFYRARGFDQIAALYLRNARHCYLRWGAEGKVRQLDELYPYLREDEPAPGPARTIGAPVKHLDLATVIKVSQAISGEIVLEKLIDTVLRTAIEQAGAARGLLILARGTEPRIAAEATTCGDTVVVQLCDETVTATILPESVLHYVLRTRESVILDDALAESPFAADPYIRERQARSILCLPLINQAKLIGVLYLENNLAPRVFVPARIAVLKLLASQAAISLENTGLYRDLAEREARIRRLVEANIIGIFIFALDGRILEANNAFLRIVGYDREDLATGRVRWTDLTPPEWLERDARQWVPELERTGILPPFEKEYFRKDGSRVPVLIGVALFKEGGDQGVTFVLDLTERKRGEEELRRSEAYLAEAEALSKSGSWAWNPAAKAIIYWSQERSRLFGFDPKAGIPPFEALLQRIHPEDREKWLANTETAIRIRGDSETDFRIVLPDGETKHLHGVGHPVFSETGELLEIIGAAMDITERKQAEEALQKAQAELAHVTRVMTMGELTSSIAHEVNQPLAAIVTNANAALRWLARQPPNLAEVRATVERIVRDGHRAGAVIGRVRALFRKTATITTRLDLNDLIQDTVALVQGEVHRHRILLRTELAPDLPPVAGDRVQLQQVILNLVLNGIEAMKEVAERPRELLIRSRPDGSGAVLVAVHDTGVGLDPQHLERVFEAFYTTKPEGMGMGLAICRSIVEAHGGQLWARANEPRGAVFQFALPAEQDETALAERAGQTPVV